MCVCVCVCVCVYVCVYVKTGFDTKLPLRVDMSLNQIT